MQATLTTSVEKIRVKINEKNQKRCLPMQMTASNAIREAIKGLKSGEWLVCVRSAAERRSLIKRRNESRTYRFSGRPNCHIPESSCRPKRIANMVGL